MRTVANLQLTSGLNEMTNNADMPAMPCDDIVIRDKNGNLQGAPISCAGLTKLEHLSLFMMQKMIGQYSAHNTPDYNGIADESIRAAKALLAQLEKAK